MVNGSRLTTGIESKSTRTKTVRVLNLFKNAAVSESDGVAVKINGAVVGEARHRAVAGELPDAALADGLFGHLSIGGFAVGSLIHIKKERQRAVVYFEDFTADDCILAYRRGDSILHTDDLYAAAAVLAPRDRPGCAQRRAAEAVHYRRGARAENTAHGNHDLPERT